MTRSLNDDRPIVRRAKQAKGAHAWVVALAAAALVTSMGTATMPVSARPSVAAGAAAAAWTPPQVLSPPGTGARWPASCGGGER